MKTYNIEEFHEILRTQYGIDIVVEFWHDSRSTGAVFIGPAMVTEPDDKKVFGYYTAGPEYPFLRTQQKEFNSQDIDVAVKTSIKVLQEYIESSQKNIDGHDVQELFKQLSQTARFKKDQMMSKWALNTIRDEWQTMFRSKIKSLSADKPRHQR